ncbi:hypothetical protein ACVBEG_15905 [Pseudomonas sp. GG8]
MFLNDADEHVARKYFDFSNDVVGVLAMALAATAMQFKHPEPFAWFFLLVIALWGFGAGGDYRRIVERYMLRYRGFWRTLYLFWRVRIFVIGVLVLSGVGLGFISEKSIYVFFKLAPI